MNKKQEQKFKVELELTKKEIERIGRNRFSIEYSNLTYYLNLIIPIAITAIISFTLNNRVLPYIPLVYSVLFLIRFIIRARKAGRLYFSNMVKKS